MAYFVIKLDGKTIMFIMQWHGCAAYKNTLHTSITKVKTHHNTPNSQENLEKAEYVIIIEFCQKINKNEAAATESFWMVHLLDKQRKPFTNGDLFKLCLNAATEDKNRCLKNWGHW